jgi:predicted GH43/DUF377 family glycosyl hydrolase
VIPSAIVTLEDGSLILYYVGANEYYTLQDFYLGMAESKDGTNWKKYDDPSTKEHPFADSDPVFGKGENREWDSEIIWMADVIRLAEGFGMYYTGMQEIDSKYIYSIGYATSEDGIHWERFPGNPIYTPQDDPYTRARPEIGFIENPTLLFRDSTCFLYYDYGDPELKIGVAVAGRR